MSPFVLNCSSHPRSCDKGLPKDRIIHNSWRNTIPDNHLTPTFYKLMLGRCPHQHSLSVAKTWAFCIGFTYCNEINRSVCMTSNWQQVPFYRWSRFYKQLKSLFVSIVMNPRISVCTSKKRFLWGPHDVGSDSLRTETVLSIQVVGFPMFYYELQIKRELKGTHLCGCRFNDSNVGVHDYMWNSTLHSSYWNLFQQKTHSG